MPNRKYRLLLITCWCVLGLCLVIKIFRSDLFIAHTSCKAFQDFCLFVDNNDFVKYGLINLPINIVSCSIYYMAILQESKITKKSLKWLIPLIIYAIIKAIFNKYDKLFYVLDIIMMLELPIAIDKTKWVWAIISFGATLLFQALSMIMKMNHYGMFDNDTVIFIILNIDYYIMLVIYYLYRLECKKEKE